MQRAKFQVAQTELPQVGSIADVAARLALWGRRAPKGLARVEFVSDFSRQEAVSQLRAALPQDKPLYEIELPYQQPAIEVVQFLRERLRGLPPGVVSIIGFATAFTDDCALADSLRTLNFHREALADFPLCQIWWMTHPFAETFLRSIPDLDSWFMLRLSLLEVIIDKSAEPFSILEANEKLYNPDEARKQSSSYIARFEKALDNHALVNGLIHLAFVAVSLLGNAALEQEEHKLAEALLRKMAPLLYLQGLLKGNSTVLIPKNDIPPFGGTHCLEMAEDFRMLGQLCECCDRAEEAEGFYKASLDMAEYLGWKDFGTLGLAFHTLTQFYLRHNRFHDAEHTCTRWLEIQEDGTDLNSYEIVYPLDEMLEVKLLQEKYAEAERIYHRMLTIARRAKLHDTDLQNSLLNNMSWFYNRLGRYAEAKALSEQRMNLQSRA